MSKQNVVYSDSQRLSVRSQVRLASNIIAPYWSVRTFVHHNPLHELESLHFEKAVMHAQKLLGGRGYLANETYRLLYKLDRINAKHIDEVLSTVTENVSVEIGRKSVSSIDVLRAHLVHGISAPFHENLSILLERHPEKEAILVLADRLKQVVEPSGIEAKARQAVNEDSSALARTCTLTDWCDRIFGTALTSYMNDELTKWSAAFVDEGQAAWGLPAREKTFYGAWKTLARFNPFVQECQPKHWQRTLESLPESPEDAILEALTELDIPESARVEYLSSHLASLPGWASFIKWRAEHSGHAWQETYQADLTQFLAIRLVYERELVKEICRKRLDIDGTYENITSYMKSYPLVYFMLRQRVDEKLPVEFAENIDRLWYRPKRPTASDWQALSLKFVTFENEKAPEQTSRSAAWRLLALAKCLTLTVQDLLSCSTQTLRCLLDWLDKFPETMHGVVWLKSMEASYQETLLGQLSERMDACRKQGADGAGGLQSSNLRPLAQAVFCIDVRSEPFRRNFEAVGRYETFGFAGFFICFIRFQSIDSHHETDQFPVIMKARNVLREVPRPYHNYKVERYRAGSDLLRAARTVLHDLKEHVITPYVTVESLGWFYSLPFVLKTFASVWYRNFSGLVKGVVLSSVSTTLTIDKLPSREAEEMVVGNQLATIRQALQERFALSGAEVSAEAVSALRESALNGDGSAVQFVSGPLANLPPERVRSFVEDLRQVYRINSRGASAHKERITRTGFTLDEQVFTIETALRTMGLTANFARIVLICAHGSTSDNNPFESALDCGACGGNEGKANARAFAAMANKIQVREALGKKGIEIPPDTHFVPAQVDTTTDVVQLFDLEDVPATHRLDLARVVSDLEEAGRLTSKARCSQFPELAADISPQQAANHVLERSTDWSQVRPEWGLSRNAAFIITRRGVTKGVDLEGRAFLHSYDYLTDPSGSLLEIIMTAPQVVTQWINMEHYFSAVDNDVYGCGSKVYHNVTGQIGVMSGTQGDLRTGLPWQTVMNGNLPYHEPLRLTTIVEAPRSTIDQIIGRHDLLKRFYHNEWVYLFALDREEGCFYRYSSAGQWQRIASNMPSAPVVEQPTANGALV